MKVNFKALACTLASGLVLASPVNANDLDKARIDAFMHNDIHFQITPIENASLRKFFNCTFYHVTTTKTSGNSAQVSFLPDTIATLPNGNTLSVSLPENTSRLKNLEKCLNNNVGTTSFKQAKLLQDGLEKLYPYMKGYVWGQGYKVAGKKVTLVTAKNDQGTNEFNVILENGIPNQIYVKFTTGLTPY